MAANGFEATVRERDGIAVIDMTGDVDAHADANLEAAYGSVRGLGVSSVLLNFEAVGYINSTGIALIVGLLANAKRDRMDVMAFGLSEHYRKIFEITRVSDFMHLYQDEKSAVGERTAS